MKVSNDMVIITFLNSNKILQICFSGRSVSVPKFLYELFNNCIVFKNISFNVLYVRPVKERDG